MRLGTSSPLRHSSPEEWAENQIKLGCRCVNFPLNSGDDEKKIIAYKEAADKNGLLIAEVGIWRNALAKDETVKMVREIIDRADVKNTFFTLEPMPWMIPTSPRDYLKLIDMVDRDRFAVHMDIINMTNSADRYFNAETFVDEVAETLGDRIKSCHIKDVHLGDEYTFRLMECGPGDGEFPLRYYVEKMNAIDPDMPVILEHLNTDEEYLKYLGYLKEELNGLY